MPKKPFNQTAVGKFLKDKAPDILDKLDDYFPPVGVLTALVKGSDTSQEVKQEFEKVLADNKEELELRLKADADEQSQLTERQRIDMSSDSWLSKNIRPLVLVYLLVSVTMICILDSCGVLTVQEYWVSLFSTLLVGFSTLYSGGRTVEKIMIHKQSKGQKTG